MKSLAAVKRRTVDVIHVFRSPLDRRRGRVRAGAVEWPCALGRAGPVRNKREGDGGTPVARLKALGAYYRPDRMGRPPLLLPTRPLRPNAGWCDDPGSRLYNRPVRVPHGSSHETMWREDDLYDLVLDLSWNRSPILRGRGSAIFLHAARPGFTPTQGCVAVARSAIVRLAAFVGARTWIVVRG